MQTLVFDSITQAASALRLDRSILKAARNLGCTAFVHGRVHAAPLVEFLGQRVQDINQQIVFDAPYATMIARLRSDMVNRAKRDVARLAAEQKPQKRFVGREIAAAVKRELTPQFAKTLVGKPAEVVEAAIADTRDRIIGASLRQQPAAIEQHSASTPAAESD